MTALLDGKPVFHDLITHHLKVIVKSSFLSHIREYMQASHYVIRTVDSYLFWIKNRQDSHFKSSTRVAVSLQTTVYLNPETSVIITSK